MTNFSIPAHELFTARVLRTTNTRIVIGCVCAPVLQNVRLQFFLLKTNTSAGRGFTFVLLKGRLINQVNTILKEIKGAMDIS